MAPLDTDTDGLLNRVRQGDVSARQRLLNRHRDRLRIMVSVRMDRRLASRVDPSDVIQDVLAEADRGLPDYVKHPPVPFYPWLRRMAWERLVELHRQHIRTKKRTVKREQSCNLQLPDESAIALVERLIFRGSSPSEQVLRHELRARVRDAIDSLAEHDREVLVLRYLEQLTTDETAAVLGISTDAVRARHVRALRRLQRLLPRDLEGLS